VRSGSGFGVCVGDGFGVVTTVWAAPVMAAATAPVLVLGAVLVVPAVVDAAVLDLAVPAGRS
jgi:hypothetical protein